MTRNETRPVTGDRTNLILSVSLALLLAAGFVLSALRLPAGPLSWSLLRATGIVSYLALAFTVTFGALLGSRVAPAWLARAQQYGWHGLLSGFALLLGMVHGLFLTVDREYAQPLSAVLIPGTSGVSPLAVGLGTVGVYALAVVWLSTQLKGRLSRRAWHVLHLLSYPAFALITLHGAMLGSDHLGLMYGAAVGASVFTFGLRWWDERGRRAGPPVRAG